MREKYTVKQFFADVVEHWGDTTAKAGWDFERKLDTAIRETLREAGINTSELRIKIGQPSWKTLVEIWGVKGCASITFEFHKKKVSEEPNGWRHTSPNYKLSSLTAYDTWNKGCETLEDMIALDAKRKDEIEDQHHKEVNDFFATLERVGITLEEFDRMVTFRNGIKRNDTVWSEAREKHESKLTKEEN